ncbi:MAG: bifunctional nuclease family protein [Thermodesulfobacteriota bacterium]
MLHEVNIAGLTLDQASNTPIIILKTIDMEDSIPIWIGLLEATSIASVLQEIHFDRPMSHDLFKNFIVEMAVAVEKVAVCDLRDNTFFAKIYFKAQERDFCMDARPSDAIAMALRFKAPIFVDDKVLQKFKSGDVTGEVLDNTDEGKKWAEYLEKLNPDDFGKYKV